MLKLIDMEQTVILRSKILRNWTYGCREIPISLIIGLALSEFDVYLFGLLKNHSILRLTANALIRLGAKNQADLNLCWELVLYILLALSLAGSIFVQFDWSHG